MSHTKEPWIAIKDGNPEYRNEAWHIEGRDGDLVTYGHMSELDARRIVACINWCEDISIEKLEAKDSSIKLGDFIRLEQQRDELLAICRNVVESGIGASDIRAMEEAIAKAEAK